MCTIITYLQFQNLIIGKKKSSDFYLFSLILRELISVWLEIIITGTCSLTWFSVTARNVLYYFYKIWESEVYFLSQDINVIPNFKSFLKKRI